MITKLVGKVDGRDIIFNRAEGDKWEATVPFDIDGTYIVEVTAYNSAGKTAFKTAVLFTFDPANLCFHFDVIDYIFEIVKEDVAIEVVHPICTVREGVRF